MIVIFGYIQDYEVIPDKLTNFTFHRYFSQTIIYFLLFTK